MFLRLKKYIRGLFVLFLSIAWIFSGWPQGIHELAFPPQVETAQAADVFRVTEYYLTTGEFTSTTYDLTLDQDLASNFFVLVRGSKVGNGGSNADNDYIRVFEVPGGTGELGDSGSSDVISLSRHVADHTWEGVVTVVECLADCSGSGFELVDIVQTSITNGSTSGTDTSTAWSDIDDVVLFGGFHGGGVEWEENAANSQTANAGQTRLYPSSTNTLNWVRNSSASLEAVTMTTFVVEWGSAWTVQRVYLSGSANGDGCNATGEYGTGAISSVSRDNTWVWGTGHSNGLGIGDSVSGTIITLGNGVDQNATETSVAYCGEYAHTKDLDVYTMTHSELAVDYRFKVDGDSGAEDLSIAIDSATDGYRFAWITNGTNGSGSAHPRDRFWARYTSDTTVMLSHGYTGQNYPAWVMGIDFSGVSPSNQTPTLSLGARPFDNEKTGDSTPDFDLVASDPDGSADIIYHIEIDNDSDFSSPIISCESDTSCSVGAGSFANTVTGGDTSPFNEGETVRFTPTTQLFSGTTYFWRVRAEDSSGSGGSGLYSDWSSSRSLTYQSGTDPSAWFQTRNEQFETGTLVSTEATSDRVKISAGYNTPAMEMGSITVSDSLSWTSISLTRTYASNPVIFVTPVTANNCEAAGTCAGNDTVGGHYPIPIVRNVSTTGFDISMCLDAANSTCETGVSSESFHWFAFDATDATNYDWIEVGTTALVDVDGSLTPVTYTTSFATTPHVWTQAQTYSQGGNIGAHAWVDSKSSSGFSYVGCVHTGAGDDCDGTASTETFGYVAIDTTNEAFSSNANFQSGSANIANSEWAQATFSPTFSAPRVMVTQNLETGGQDPQYAWARDVTTSGMDFRYCEQDDATTCNSHNPEDVFWFAVEDVDSASSGTIMSPEIDFDTLSGATGWDEVSFSTTESNGDVKLRVYYSNSTACDTLVPDVALSGNSTGFDISSSPIDISALNTTTYNEICLHATLTNSGGTPFLNDWQVTWLTGSVYSISITSSGTIEYGSINVGQSSTTVSNGYTQTVLNDGQFNAKINIKSSDATGGIGWTLATSIGTDQFIHEFSTTTGAVWAKMPDSSTYVVAHPSLPESGTINTDFRLVAPAASTDYDEKSVTITVQAVAP